MTNNYAFTFGELDSSTANDGYGGLFIKFRTEQEINYITYEVGEKKPAILFDMRTNPIDWSMVTSPLLVNGKGLAVNKASAPNVGLDIGTNDAIRVPVGTTGQRPDSAETGYIRYNSSTNDFEGYKNTGWTSLTSGGGSDLVAGTGLTLSDDTLTVDAAQSGITSVGTLSSLNVSGTVGVDGVSTFNEEVVFTRGTSSSSHIHYGGNKDWYIRSGETDGKVIIQDPRGGSSGGNVGIGTSSPSCKLHVVDSSSEGKIIIENETLALLQLKQPTSSKTYNIELGRTDGELTFRSTTGERMRLTESGNLGIGTTSPSFSLHIVGGGLGNSGVINDTSAYYIGHDGFGVNNLPPTSSGHNFATSSYRFSLYCTKSIFSERYIAASDSRIKDNIEDIPDDTALQMVRDIPCRYYTYRDVVDRGYNRTIGFIAQEVKDVIPEAVDEISEYIPDEYRLLTASNKQWSYTNGEYHLKVTDLEITPNSSYRFIVGNNDGIDQETLEIEPNSDDTFTFSKTWSKIFLYGSRVNDFHVLDKQKIFAVHHAAIQELDRINTEQAQRIQTLETQLVDVVARLTALENA